MKKVSWNSANALVYYQCVWIHLRYKARQPNFLLFLNWQPNQKVTIFCVDNYIQTDIGHNKSETQYFPVYSRMKPE
jgi:hypothetical protein